MRIRVALDIRKPVERKMKKKKKVGGEWSWLNFRYERFPLFCFLCGVIEHANTFCEKRFDNYQKGMVMPYGTWLRATTRPKASALGNQSLRLTEDGRTGGGQEGRNVKNGPDREGKWKEGDLT